MHKYTSVTSTPTLVQLHSDLSNFIIKILFLVSWVHLEHR